MNDISILSRSTTRLVTLDEVKKHCRLPLTSTAEDTSLEAKIDTATELIEDDCRVSLVETQYRLYIDGFPCRDEKGRRPLELKRGPVVSVEKVEYFNELGVWVEIDEADYFVNLRDDFPNIIEQIDKTWPEDVSKLPYSVRVEYTAEVPVIDSRIKHAICEVVAYLRRASGGVTIENLQEMPGWANIKRLLRGLK